MNNNIAIELNDGLIHNKYIHRMDGVSDNIFVFSQVIVYAVLFEDFRYTY